MRPAAYVVGTVFWCHLHGVSEMTRAYSADGELVGDGGSLFPCACWYRLGDAWHGEVGATVSDNGMFRQMELWSEK